MIAVGSCHNRPVAGNGAFPRFIFEPGQGWQLQRLSSCSGAGLARRPEERAVGCSAHRAIAPTPPCPLALTVRRRVSTRPRHRTPTRQHLPTYVCSRLCLVTPLCTASRRAHACPVGSRWESSGPQTCLSRLPSCCQFLLEAVFGRAAATEEDKGGREEGHRAMALGPLCGARASVSPKAYVSFLSRQPQYHPEWPSDHLSDSPL